MQFSKKLVEKIQYKIFTNRPIGNKLKQLKRDLSLGRKSSDKIVINAVDCLTKEIKSNASQQFNANQIKKLFRRVDFKSKPGLLDQVINTNNYRINILMASNSEYAGLRLAKLREIIRSKAGTSGEKKEFDFKTRCTSSIRNRL